MPVTRNENARRQFRTETGRCLAPDAHQNGPISRSRLNQDAGARNQPESLHFAKRRRIAIADAANGSGHVAGPSRQFHFGSGGDGSVFSGDGVAVGIDPRITQPRGDAIFQAFRNVVFQALGFLMHLVPGVIEDVMEKTLEQTVVADHLEGATPSGRAESYSAMLFVGDEGFG